MQINRMFCRRGAAVWGLALLLSLPLAAAAQDSAAGTVIPFTEEQMAEAGIEVLTASPAKLEAEISLPGEVKINQDRLAHIVPRLAGVVREVRKSLGEKVQAGEVMVVLDSPELADAKAAYLAARERTQLYQSGYEREKRLYENSISPEQDYLKARQEWAEARIGEQSAQQKLAALGLSEEYIAALPRAERSGLTRYEVTAPFGGTIIQRHVTLGEVVKADDTIFVLSDLDTVWVDLSVYQRDLPHVNMGQRVRLSISGFEPLEAPIAYVGPLLGEESRTALARVVLPNQDGRLRPGLFVTGAVISEEMEAGVAVPPEAVQGIGGEDCVFVRKGDQFEVRVVRVGQRTKEQAEILSGLTAGERFAGSGTFILKSELGKHEAAEE